MQFFEIAKGRPKRGIFEVFKGQVDVLGLEGLESNKGKFKGLWKKGKSIKDKIGRAKVQFFKVWQKGNPTGSFSDQLEGWVARGMVWATLFVKGLGRPPHEVAGI